MQKWFQNRIVILCVSVFLLCVILLGRLYYLTIVQGDYYYNQSVTNKTISLEQTGSRGTIYDTNLVALAENKYAYNLRLDLAEIPSDRSELIDMLVDLVLKMEELGEMDQLVYNMPIRYQYVSVDVGGDEYVFDEDAGIGEEDINQGTSTGPQEVTEGTEIEFYYTWEGLSEATQASRMNRWLSDTGLKARSAQAMYEYLRTLYDIPTELTAAQALYVISFRLDIYINRYRGYEPVAVAEDISFSSVVEMQKATSELPGLEVTMDELRYYPQGSVAGHTLGYVGSVSTEMADTYANAGYDINSAVVGKTGIELAAEDWLTAETEDKKGSILAEVDNVGTIVNILDEEEAQDGYDVVLTIDSRYQRKVENFLREEIERLKNLEDSSYSGGMFAPYVTKSCAVVIDVRDGGVVALANSVSYDPNVFIPSISTEDYQAIISDPLKPLTSMATQERYAPGSTFKMFVGISALMDSVIKLGDEVYCAPSYDKYGTEQAPHCWVRNLHGNEDFINAIKHSCDMYFYETADRMGIDTIAEYANLLGMNGFTGIEIDEVESSVGSRDRKEQDEMQNIKYELRYYLRQYGCFTDETSEETKTEQVDILAALSTSVSQTTVRDILRNQFGYFPLTEDAQANQAANAKLQELTETIIYSIIIPRKLWQPGDTIRTGIGQAYVQETPINLARYTAMIASDGKLFDLHLIDKVLDKDGNVVYETPAEYEQLDIPEAYLNAAQTGMWRVLNDLNSAGGGAGTVAHAFQYDVRWDLVLAGKTGTAETDTSNDQYNTALFVCYAPYDDPEIAMSIVVPNGTASASVIYTAKEIVNMYFDFQNIDILNDEIDLTEVY